MYARFLSLVIVGLIWGDQLLLWWRAGWMRG